MKYRIIAMVVRPRFWPITLGGVLILVSWGIFGRAGMVLELLGIVAVLFGLHLARSQPIHDPRVRLNPELRDLQPELVRQVRRLVHHNHPRDRDHRIAEYSFPAGLTDYEGAVSVRLHCPGRWRYILSSLNYYLTGATNMNVWVKVREDVTPNAAFTILSYFTTNPRPSRVLLRTRPSELLYTPFAPIDGDNARLFDSLRLAMDDTQPSREDLEKLVGLLSNVPSPAQ